jgi:hypothetical protein
VKNDSPLSLWHLQTLVVLHFLIFDLRHAPKQNTDMKRRAHLAADLCANKRQKKEKTPMASAMSMLLPLGTKLRFPQQAQRSIKG